MRTISKCVGAFVAAFALSTTVGASAMTVESSIKSYTVSGYRSYFNQSTAEDTYRSASIDTWSNPNPGTNHIASQAQMYRVSSGALCSYSSWVYNNTGTHAFASVSTGSACTGGDYRVFSQGRSQVWTGGAYVTYTGYRTPDLYI